MRKNLDISEIIFKILSYLFVTVFALCCLYPFIFVISAALSSTEAIDSGKVIFLPVDIQLVAFKAVILENRFWVSYTNTLFITLYGTIWCMITSMLGAYALSKKRLVFRKQLNFLLVFTMWFAAGMYATFLNYYNTQEIMHGIGITDNKWLIVIAMGTSAYNVILLRNAFEGVPKEIEEAATVDGASEFQIFSKVYIPMSKATIATVALFFGISRWNGYFWAKQMLSGDPDAQPLQVFIRNELEKYIEATGDVDHFKYDCSPYAYIYAMIVCAIIPVIIIYPFIQKYFAVGVNLGGVKE